MSYMTVHKTKESFELAVMWLLVAAFLVAVALMFLHPTGALAIFSGGLLVLLAAVVVVHLFRRAERREARRELAGHHCPGCGAVVGEEHHETGVWHCPSCRAEFQDSGATVA